MERFGVNLIAGRDGSWNLVGELVVDVNLKVFRSYLRHAMILPLEMCPSSPK